METSEKVVLTIEDIEREERIVRACLAVRERGIGIVQGEWGIHVLGLSYEPEYGVCCALGACLVGQPVVYLDDDTPLQEELAAEHVLGLPMPWIDGFMEGFDGGTDPMALYLEPEERAPYRRGYQVGRRVAAFLFEGEEQTAVPANEVVEVSDGDF